MKGVVPTVCLMSQLPTSMWGIILRMLLRSASAAWMNLQQQQQRQQQRSDE
jgi:hypothetical protein